MTDKTTRWATLPNCHDCGRFMRVEPGVAWKMVYSMGALPEPDREIFRCIRCIERMGEFEPQHGIVPAYSGGVITNAE